MTLLEDLQSLDLSAILDAKADISITVNGDSLLKLAEQGPAQSVLGDLGTVIGTATAAMEDPEELVAPLVELIGSLLDHLDLGDLPLAEYVDTITAAARIIAQVVTTITGDPLAIGGASLGGSASGIDLGAVFDAGAGALGEHASVVTGELGRVRALLESLEGGLPQDPSALVDAALEVMIPFAASGVEPLGSWAGSITTGLARVRIDPALTSGLVTALGQVTIAANGGSSAELEAALAQVQTVRAATVNQLAAALRSATSAVSALGISEVSQSLQSLRATLGSADESVFDMLDGWREMIASLRVMVTGIDSAEVFTRFNAVLDELENKATEVLLAAVDGSVEVVKQWLRDLLREVPVRPLRAKVSDAIAEVATAIGDADLDAPVDAIKGVLGSVGEALESVDPAALIQAAVDDLEEVLSGAIDDLGAALAGITDAINAVASQAEAILQRAVAGLSAFSGVVEELTAAIEDAGILEAAEEIRRTLGELREDVSSLLSKAPVPDALRTGVEQIITTIESIDIDAVVTEPLEAVAAKLQIPAEVATTVREGLDAIAETIVSVVPTDVIADLQEMMGSVISEIENLDISELTSGVGDVLDDAASVFESVNMVELLEPASAGFQQVIAKVDNVHPRILLKPAIDLYAQLLGAIPVPDPQTMSTRAAAVTSTAGEAVARAAAEPMRTAVDPDATTPPAGSQSEVRREEPPPDLRPGDVVRLLGLLPAKLREALQRLDSSAVGAVMGSIEEVFGGTAGKLRAARDAILAMELSAEQALDLALAPLVAVLQQAQLALDARVSVDAAGLEVDASFSVLATAQPDSISASLSAERELLRNRSVDASSTLTGRMADDLDAVADLLEAFLPSGILNDVDSLLAALDPEPIAAEMDALMGAVLDLMPSVIAGAEAEIRSLEARIRGLIDTFNPGSLMQRYLGVLDVIREELSLLDPGRLADELGEVHAQLKAALVAYDPGALAAELDALLGEVAAAIRGLDPAEMMPDLSGIGAQVARVGEILPVNALEGVGTQLEAVGDELRKLDITAMIEAVNLLPGEVEDSISLLAKAISDELVNLLKSIRYSSSSGSASASVSVSVGVG